MISDPLKYANYFPSFTAAMSEHFLILFATFCAEKEMFHSLEPVTTSNFEQYFQSHR